jgi:two-component system nitrate/nitrite response regulator NarL
MSSSTAKAVPSPSSRRMEAIRVLIAEDTPMSCQLLSETLRRSRQGLRIVQRAVTSSEAIQLVGTDRIDIALISEDLQDGARKGLHAVKELRNLHPNIQSIVLVKNVERELIVDIFRSGAKGVFCRKQPIEVLCHCIRAVHRGQVWVDSEQLQLILQALIESKPVRITNLQGTCLLTKREDEVASLVAEGLTNREVAERLGLSEHTVSNYLFKIYEKLGISRRVEFVLYFFSRRQRNLVPSTGEGRLSSKSAVSI